MILLRITRHAVDQFHRCFRHYPESQHKDDRDKVIRILLWWWDNSVPIIPAYHAQKRLESGCEFRRWRKMVLVVKDNALVTVYRFDWRAWEDSRKLPDHLKEAV